MIIEGTTEKVLQFSMLIMSIFNQNPGFNENVCNFQGDQIGQNFAIWAIFYGVGQIFI
jgi:hypothetical protein